MTLTNYTKISSPCLFLGVVLLFIFIPDKLSAQNYFKATLKDSLTGEVLSGATVMEKGTKNGSSSDFEGSVKFKVSGSGNIIFHLQFIGYYSKDITVQIPQSDTALIVLLSPTNEELETVTISTDRSNSRIEDIPTRIEVLGLDDLNEENGVKPGNITSLLGDIAGVQLQQVSASSGNTFARIQGLNGRYTQLLKDGMPLFGGLSGNFGIMQIPPLDLKQIEIIKGSSSTLYGGDAIGGIINLVSKDPGPKPEFTATANISTLKESNLNGYYAQKFKNFGFTLFASNTFQREGDIDKDGLSDVPLISSTVIHPKLILYPGKRSTITLNYTGTFDTRKGGDMHYLMFGSPDSFYHVNNSVSRNSADAKWLMEFTPKKVLTLKFSVSNLSQQTATKSYHFNGIQNIIYSEISYLYKLPKMVWIAGLNFNGDVFQNKSASLIEVKDYQYQTLGLFIQNTWKPTNRFTVEAGFRGDRHSQYGYFALPRLSLMYKLNSSFTARLGGGLGYKVPVLLSYVNIETDLDKITPGMVLNPENSKGFNADINFQTLYYGKLSITINQSFFFTQIAQPIYDTSTQTSKVSLVNQSSAIQTQGLQTYARIRYTEFELYLGYVFTYVTKLFDSQNPFLAVTPKHNLSGTFFYEPNEDWRIGFESSLIAGQLDQNYKPVRNYVLLAAMVQHTFDKITLVLNCENLLDFRQNSFGRIYDGTISNPAFHKLWAPIDGRVINLSVKWRM